MQYQFQPDTLRKQQMSAYDQAMQAGIQHGLHATSGSYGLPPQHYLQFPPYQGPPPLVQPQPIVHHAPVAYQQAAEPQTDKDMSPYVPSSAVFLAHSPKPYQCAVGGCDKKYKQLTGIINHHYERHRHPLQDDNNEKLFRCEVPLCGMLYKQAGGLAYHIERAHANVRRVQTPHPRPTNPEEKPYQCEAEECGKRFKSTNGLQYHREKRHGVQGTPPQAQAQAKEQSGSSSSAGAPNFVCQACDAVFAEFGMLAYHYNHDHVEGVQATLNKGPARQ